jgi:beta-galactosidase/beta-glucuronidase
MLPEKIHIHWRRRVFGTVLLLLVIFQLPAQQQYELNTGWKCIKAQALNKTGAQLSDVTFPLTGFMPAVVPGTVLTSLLENKQVPDPYYGMNNELIPDIYRAGRGYYTYWFVNDFTEPYPRQGDKVFILFRGINYSADIFVNGRRLNDATDKGMFLRQSYELTPFLNKDGRNRIAVIVYPPDSVGNPNGGQGGDGMIAHGVTNQYVAGWDWIQPVRDRNTGIWDKVFIKRSGTVHVENTHVVTFVPGRRTPGPNQKAASVKVTSEIENTDSAATIDGVAQLEIAGKKLSVKVSVAPMTSELVDFPVVYIDSPRLWWPNGYGDQPLYDLKVKFLINGKQPSDEEKVTFGIRELKAVWNKKTNSRELRVNGQKIFIKGGNRILSDAMLRFSKERYDAEIRYHRDMNLNLIRVWGGGITERPEFYEACDRYGLMVMQDFWVSGDCNGRWYDPLKLEDTNARRQYPDDHKLFMESLEDQVRMLRNHPSLVYWCGGNEIRPPADILIPFRDSVLHELDSTRFFFEFSNDDSMSLHSGDGPYTIQKDLFFREHKSFPFNSEVGSVGTGDYTSLERFIPANNLVPPYYDPKGHQWVVDSVWKYHKYSGYDSSVLAYGAVKDCKDFARKAQLVNYNQYRALIEGYAAHMWDWYTGVIIWKTQNPWTALVGQMYDVYLDPNACLFGLREGAQPVHVMYDPIKRNIEVLNNGFKATPVLEVAAFLADLKGDIVARADTYITVPASKVVVSSKVPAKWDSLRKSGGYFYGMVVTDTTLDSVYDHNMYWMPDKNGSFAALEQMPRANLSAEATLGANGRVSVQLKNPAGAMAFFLHLAIVDAETKQRVLPVFCNNNYISVFPASSEFVELELKQPTSRPLMVEIEGWNVPKMYIDLKTGK